MNERQAMRSDHRGGGVSATAASCAALFSASLGLALPALAQDPSPAWAMPTPHAPNTFLSANVQRFAEDLAAVSAGNIRIEIRSGSRLFADGDIEEAVREGRVPLGEFMLSSLASADPLFGADTLPFLASGYRRAERLWQASRTAIESRLEERNLVLLFAVPVPPPVLLTRRPLEEAAALRGLKFRVPADGTGEGLAQLFAVARRLGSVPVLAGTWTLSAAFEEGRLDAMLLPLPQALGLGAQRFAPYLYLVRPWLPKSAVVMNRGVYEAFDPPLRDALLEAARAAEERGWRTSRREVERLLGRMAQRGFSRMPVPERLWADIARIRRESTVEWTERTGEEGVAVIEAFYAPR